MTEWATTVADASSNTAPTVEEFKGTAAEWDDFVRAQQGWSHFHLHGWKRVMTEALGHDTPYLAARGEGGVLVGVLPLVRVKSVLFGHYLVSMPFLNYGGPLGSDDAIRALTDHATSLARRDRVKLLEFRSRYEQSLSIRASARKITTLLDLVPGDADAVFKRFDGGIRNRIRKSAKSGIVVRFGADQVAGFHAVFSEHMRFLGTPTHGLRFFETIAETFPDDSLFACAWLGDVPVAGGMGFFWNGEFEMSMASALRRYDSTKANMGLYWAVMQRAIAAGCTTFNFGRSTPDGGTHEFKRHWGGRDEPLYWYDFSPSGRAVATPSPKDDVYSWGPRVWKKLPLGLTRALGPRIVRLIP